MKKIGVVSYNIYCNFTNYGSALQSWALCQAIKKVSDYTPVLVDYCPTVHLKSNPLNPFKEMLDQDETSLKMCKLTLPAIRENYYKFDDFYHSRFELTKNHYTPDTLDSVGDEALQGFVCGSDTIFCTDEFGVDDGYFANYKPMKGSSIAYAASFGDSHMTQEVRDKVRDRLGNFKSIGLRERSMIPFVQECVNVLVKKVIDPTLLMTPDEYTCITQDRIVKDKYLLLYSRRYSPVMEEYAEKLAKENGWKIVEISLRATNAEKGHLMYYNAGVEEFLSLVKNAEFVVTNSFHGIIFSVQLKKQFKGFNRDRGNTKISELMDLFGLDQVLYSENSQEVSYIDYEKVHENISVAREYSLAFLKESLSLLDGN